MIERSEKMKNYTITGCEIYECPQSPTENGTYYGKTPILNQAQDIVKKAKENGKEFFVKAFCDDGVKRYL